ncbi:MAG: Guanosine-5-triphosphate,3-diphosphate diphosphatase [Myxococcaceae bacterium]|nr:Guanosine-5-triphosphate,3-diphosphate diphosphatase [Myxococcaceae bacterium]
MTSEAPPGGPVAAVDLGSNSFHMVIARVVDGHLKVVDRMRERVQLAMGLDAEGGLAPDAEARAFACLQRFGQRLAETPKTRVRAVGTNTFRRAKNRRVFLRRCEEKLGHSIDVLPGSEEARILFRGVTHDLPAITGQRLVVDIGGGSTECILGTGEEAQRADSLQMGCVTYSDRFFKDGKITRDRFRQASLSARLELEPVERIFRKADFIEAIGSSGTINAIDAMIRGVQPSSVGITLSGIKALRDAAIERGHIDKLNDLPGLSPDRRTVIMGGLAVLHAVFKSIEIARPMRASKSALREGLLLELVGSLGATDVRERTVDRLTERYAVDVEQARRVEETALALARQLQAGWGLSSRELRVLRWSARLHELGQVLSFGGYHRHGAYIVANSDMPGFSEQGQSYIAALIGAHRRRLEASKLALLRQSDGERAVRLALLLRIAVRINRGRVAVPAPEVRMIDKDKLMELEFPKGFLEGSPMTRADLEEEQSLLKVASFELTFK